jgi:hypothetical protein
MKRITNRKVLGYGAIICVILLCGPYLWAWVLMLSISGWFWDISPETPWAAKQLCNSAPGIRLCLNDADIFGGSTEGWSSWVLAQSSRGEVDRELRNILDDNKVDFDKRFEAASILWERTQDKQYIAIMYDLVRKPGAMPIRFGRSHLISQLIRCGVTQDIVLMLDKPESEELDFAECPGKEYWEHGAVLGTKY